MDVEKLTRLRAGLVVGAVLLVAAGFGCGSGGPTEPEGTSSLVVNLAGFGADSGRPFALRVFETYIDDNREFLLAGAEVDSVRLVAIPGDEFSVTVQLPFDSIYPYLIECYVDADGSGDYSGPPTDHTARTFADWEEDSVPLVLTEPYPELDWP